MSDFFTFCLSGTIPGTHYIVSPDAVMYGAASFICLLFVILALRLHASHVQRQIGPVWKASSQFDTSASNISDREAARMRQLRDYPEVTWRMKIRLAIASWQNSRYDTLSSLGVCMNDGMKSVSIILIVTLARIFLGTVITVGLLCSSIVAVIKFISSLLATVWHAAEPALWRLDGWLESGVSAVVARISARLSRYESIRNLQMIVQACKKQTGLFGSSEHTEAQSVSLEPLITTIQTVSETDEV